MEAITQKQIDSFWQERKRFLRIALTTEATHPLTTDLSQLCSSNLEEAFSIFKKVELEAITKLVQYSDGILSLKDSIQKCLDQSGNIYLIGCGASARLAVLMRRLCEIYHPSFKGRVISVSSGGDVSLIRSVEQFEDSKEFGIKQLQQQSFTQNDLLIGLSASGESPFILASINYAFNLCKHTPWLICNNSIVDILSRNPDYNIISNINTLALNVGAMALTGSTRLQATTAMQIALGIALCFKNINIEDYIKQVSKMIDDIKLTDLAKITYTESNILKNQEYILYTTNDTLLGLSMLADITERSPTFNINQFENYSSNTTQNKNIYSPFYLCLSTNINVDEVWNNILGQEPICLNWANFKETTPNYIKGFDISNNSPRVKLINLPNKQHNICWNINKNTLNISLQENICSFKIPHDRLSATILFKFILNSHSTLMFGIIGAYEGNLMISLKPSNFKLMDRAIRYSKFILYNKYNLTPTYEDIANILFEEINKLKQNESIVKNIIHRFIMNHKK